MLKIWPKKLIIGLLLVLIVANPVSAAVKKIITGAVINIEKVGENASVTWNIPQSEKEKTVYINLYITSVDYRTGETKTEAIKKEVPWAYIGATTIPLPQVNKDSMYISRVEMVNNPPFPNVDQVIIEKDCEIYLTKPYAEFTVSYTDSQITATWNAEKISHLADRPDISNLHLQVQRPGAEWEEATSNLSTGIYTMQVEPQEMSQAYRFRFVFRDNEVWGDKVWSVVVTGTQPPIEDEGRHGEEQGLTTGDKGIPIFPADRQEVIMFWYKILAGLSGAFIFLILIRAGYQHMVNPSPASKASLIETIQMSIIGILIISFAPMFVTILININNGFVDLCLDTYNALTAGSPSEFVQEAQMGDTEWMDRFIAAPFRTLCDLITTLFGLAPLGEVIFNEAPESSILANHNLFKGEINVGNELGTVLLSLALLGFTVYYNAVYTIRRWVVTAVLGATPIIIWIWVLSRRRQIIEIWLSELIQTIFMQSFHALTFGIFFSILCFTGNPGVVNSQFAHMLIEVGKFLAAFGGVICFGVIILQGFKIVASSEEKARAEAVGNIKKALLGLIILGLAGMMAAFLASEPLTIHFPPVSGGGESKITLWQLFFVLIAIIPVSKMFSTIFMSFLARIGTVDEDAWAARGLGIMGGVVALGKASAGALKNAPVVSGTRLDSDKAGSTSTGGQQAPAGVSQGTGGQQTGVSSGTASTGGQQAGVSSWIGSAGGQQAGETSPRSATTPGIYEAGIVSDYQTPAETDFPGTGSSTMQTEPTDITPESVYADPPGRRDEETKEPVKEEAAQPDPQAQQVKYRQAILNTRGTVDNAVNIGKHVGKAAGFAAPGADKALASFFGVGARTATAPLASAHAIYRLGKELPEGSRTLTNITGRETKLGAGVQTAATILLSPLGESSVNLALKVGSAIDSFQSRRASENT